MCCLYMNNATLFRSQVFVDILKLFFNHQGSKFFVREIARLTHHDAGLVQRELSRMEKENLIIGATEGKNKYFSLSKSGILPHLQAILEEKEAGDEILTIVFQEHWISPLTISPNLCGWPALRADRRFLKTDIGTTATTIQNNSLKYAVSLTKITAASDEIDRKIFDRGFFTSYDKVFRKKCAETRTLLNNLTKDTPIDSTWINDLSRLYNFGIELCQIGYIGVLTDLVTNNCSQRIKRIIEPHLATHKVPYSRPEIVSIFGSPIELTFSNERELALLKICQKLLKGGKKNTLSFSTTDKKKIIDLYYTYYWTNFGHFGFKRDTDTALKEAEEILNIYTTQTLADRIHELETYPSATKLKKQEIAKLLEISKEEMTVVEIAAVITYHKALRLELLSGLNACLRLFVEAVHRKIKVVPLNYLYQCTLKELIEVYYHGIDDEKITTLQSRDKFVVWIAGSDIDNIKVISGKEAHEYFKIHLKEMETDIREVEKIHGTVAYPGKVRGKVKVLNSPRELEKIEAGDILVTHQTVPEMLPGMKRAAAFVTDSGGITCHAAIVAREMKKPCITGTQISTKILKDGDLIEVDAYRGEITIIHLS